MKNKVFRVIMTIFTAWAVVMALVFADALRHDYPDAVFWIKFVIVSIVLTIGILWYRVKDKRDHEVQIDEMAKKEKEKME